MKHAPKSTLRLIRITNPVTGMTAERSAHDLGGGMRTACIRLLGMSERFTAGNGRTAKPAQAFERAKAEGMIFEDITPRDV